MKPRPASGTTRPRPRTRRWSITTHAVSSAFQFTNVPTGVWIDEKGRVVRPGEPAWTTSRTAMYGGKPLVTEGAEYVAGIRDWVANGDRSSYALSDAAFTARVKPRSQNEMDADASFALAVWFHNAKNDALAKNYFERAQTAESRRLELSPAGLELHARRGRREVDGEIPEARQRPTTQRSSSSQRTNRRASRKARARNVSSMLRARHPNATADGKSACTANHIDFAESGASRNENLSNTTGHCSRHRHRRRRRDCRRHPLFRFHAADQLSVRRADCQ